MVGLGLLRGLVGLLGWFWRALWVGRLDWLVLAALWVGRLACLVLACFVCWYFGLIGSG